MDFISESEPANSDEMSSAMLELSRLRDSMRFCNVGPVAQPFRGDLQHFTPFPPSPTEQRLSLLVKLATVDATMDRAIGSMVGLAVGDSVGAPLEFIDAVESGTGASKVDIGTLTYRNACNRFGLLAGQWTDDASMGLALADSLRAPACLPRRASRSSAPLSSHT